MASPDGAAIDYCLVPLQAPPSDQVSNFITPVDLVTPTIAVSAVFTVLSLAFLAGRFVQNWSKMRASDYLVIFGFVLSTSYTGVVLALRNFSRHAWDVPMCWYLADSAWQLLFASNLLLGPTQFFVKVAILLLYFQLFATTKKTRWSIIAACIFSGLLYLIHPILVIVFTAPRHGQTWPEPALTGMSAKLTYYAPIHGIGSVLLDMWILIISVPAIAKLHVSLKKKAQLFFVFIIGFLAVISSIFSCYWRFNLTFDHPGDSTWYEGQLFIWVIIENNIAIMVGSMPALAGTVKTHIPGSFRSMVSRLRGATTGSGSSQSRKSSLPFTQSTPISFTTGGRGRPVRKYQPDYYELSEPCTQKSRAVASESLSNSALRDELAQGIRTTKNLD